MTVVSALGSGRGQAPTSRSWHPVMRAASETNECRRGSAAQSRVQPKPRSGPAATRSQTTHAHDEKRCVSTRMNPVTALHRPIGDLGDSGKGGVPHNVNVHDHAIPSFDPGKGDLAGCRRRLMGSTTATQVQLLHVHGPAASEVASAWKLREVS
jgi:hypothetical protein